MDFITPKTDWTPSIASGEFPDDDAFNRIEKNNLYNHDVFSVSGNLLDTISYGNLPFLRVGFTLEDDEVLTLRRVQYYMAYSSTPTTPHGFKLLAKVGAVENTIFTSAVYGAEIAEDSERNVLVWSNATGGQITGYITISMYETNTTTSLAGASCRFEFQKEAL